MPYVKGDGTIVDRDPKGFFWGIINFFYLFFQSLMNPSYDKKESSTAGGSGSTKKTGGFGPSGSGSPDPPPMGGCSSCG